MADRTSWFAHALLGKLLSHIVRKIHERAPAATLTRRIPARKCCNLTFTFGDYTDRVSISDLLKVSLVK
jgi:hypothetical protein